MTVSKCSVRLASKPTSFITSFLVLGRWIRFRRLQIPSTISDTWEEGKESRSGQVCRHSHGGQAGPGAGNRHLWWRGYGDSSSPEPAVWITVLPLPAPLVWGNVRLLLESMMGAANGPFKVSLSVGVKDRSEEHLLHPHYKKSTKSPHPPVWRGDRSIASGWGGCGSHWVMHSGWGVKPLLPEMAKSWHFQIVPSCYTSFDVEFNPE